MGRSKGAQGLGQRAEAAAKAPAAAQDEPGPPTCSLCKQPVHVHSEEHIAAQCNSCGTVSLHCECVDEVLSKQLKAGWTSSKGTLAAVTQQLHKFPWKALAKLASGSVGVSCFACQEGRLQSSDLQRPVRKLVPLPPQAPGPGPRRGKAAGASGSAGAAPTTATTKTPAPPPAAKLAAAKLAQRPAWTLPQQRQQSLGERMAGPGAGTAGAAPKPRRQPTFAEQQEQEARQALQQQEERRQQLREQQRQREQRQAAEAAALAAAELGVQKAELQRRSWQEASKDDEEQLQGWGAEEWTSAAASSAGSAAGWELHTPEQRADPAEYDATWGPQQEAQAGVGREGQALPWLGTVAPTVPQPAAYEVGYAAGLAAAAAQLQLMGSISKVHSAPPSTPSTTCHGLPDWLQEEPSAEGSAAHAALPLGAGEQSAEEVEQLMVMLGLA